MFQILFVIVIQAVLGYFPGHFPPHHNSPLISLYYLRQNAGYNMLYGVEHNLGKLPMKLTY